MSTQDEQVKRFERLPKWAQDDIIMLRRKVDDLRSELKAQQCSELSRIKWGWSFRDDTAKGYLRDDEHLSFVLKDSQKVMRIHFSHDGNLIECHCDGQVVVRGVSRNWVTLEVD